MDKGCIQIYHGTGKGKTTAAVGLLLRAAGQGFSAGFAQFLKDGSSGECRLLASLPGIALFPFLPEVPFTFAMTPEQRDEAAAFYAGLLERVEQIHGLERIRFMTSHPKDLSDDLIRVMAKSEKICRHLHLPLQSGSSRLLKKMNRHYDKEQYLALAKKIQEAIPDISLTTDIIVGFPGETEEDFEETMDVVRQVRYDSAFTFIYSKRTGTPAAAMEDQVPIEVTQPRFDRLLKEVQEIAKERCSRDLGRVMKVLVEGMDDHDSSNVTGRLGNNTMVHFPGDASLIGKIVSVRLTEARGFYYMGRMEEE